MHSFIKSWEKVPIISPSKRTVEDGWVEAASEQQSQGPPR